MSGLLFWRHLRSDLLHKHQIGERLVMYCVFGLGDNVDVKQKADKETEDDN